MTGREVMDRALQLLGYTAPDGEPDAAAAAELYKRGVPLIDQLCHDLAVAEGAQPFTVASLQQPLPLSDAAVRGALPYGVAMLTAAARGDRDQQQLFAAFYTAKRRTLRHGERLRDVLPRGWDE